MAEWFKAAVLKTVVRKYRGFESYSLRQDPTKRRDDRAGRWCSPAKRVWGLHSTEGSNPSLSATYAAAPGQGLRAAFFVAPNRVVLHLQLKTGNRARGTLPGISTGPVSGCRVAPLRVIDYTPYIVRFERVQMGTLPVTACGQRIQNPHSRLRFIQPLTPFSWRTLTQPFFCSRVLKTTP